MNLKKILMDLGNGLVERGFDPSGPLPEDLRHELANDHTTYPIAVFTEWLNLHPEAREILQEIGVQWPTAPRMSSAEGNGSNRHMKIKDILPDEAISRLTPILNKINAGKLDPFKGKDKILEVLNDYREQLLAKEILPEYLAYVLLHMATGG